MKWIHETNIYAFGIFCRHRADVRWFDQWHESGRPSITAYTHTPLNVLGQGVICLSFESKNKYHYIILWSWEILLESDIGMKSNRRYMGQILMKWLKETNTDLKLYNFYYGCLHVVSWRRQKAEFTYQLASNDPNPGTSSAKRLTLWIS